MGLLFEKKVNGPATHAIVIGVGYYTHLLGGNPNKLFSKHGGLGQLTSPPISAREFTNWLLTKYKNTETPLSSLNLFLSDPKSDEYKIPNSGEIKKVERAKKDRVKRGILDWYARGDKDKDNLMLFYFCGHGVSSGFRTLLLLEDFGETPLSPFDNSIKFDDGLWLGMDQCAARKQCYFIDACRKGSYHLAQTYGDPGDPIIWGQNIVQRRELATFYSTVLGDAAYSRPNSPSFFTEALLRALNGAGANDLYGSWNVSADSLALGLNSIMKTVFDEDCEARVSSLFLHQIDDTPIVPAVVWCEPKDANSVAQLSYSLPDGSKNVLRSKPEATDWVVDVEVGRYVFQAKFTSRTYNSNLVEKEVRPPTTRVPIGVV